jgi:ferrous iron transport protein A
VPGFLILSGGLGEEEASLGTERAGTQPSNDESLVVAGPNLCGHQRGPNIRASLHWHLNYKSKKRSQAMPLSSAKEGELVRVVTLPTHSILRDRLVSMGVKPGVLVEVLRRGKPGGIIHVACGILEFMIRHEHAAQMEVSYQR